MKPRTDVMVKIVCLEDCCWGVRAKRHCDLLKIPTDLISWERKNTAEQSIDWSLPLPQVYVNDHYIGGFYELVEYFPI